MRLSSLPWLFVCLLVFGTTVTTAAPWPLEHHTHDHGYPRAADGTGAEDTDAKEGDAEADQSWDVSAPIADTYEAKIDTTEGTWMNLDVSPDGQEIVFDLLGDLYRLPIEGGDAEALSSGIAWDMQPRYSPSGDHIAFTSDAGGGDNIWIMKVDGSDRQAVTEESFRLLNNADWSPDGDYLVARKHFTGRRSLGAGEIWLYHHSGGGGLQLTEKANDQKDVGEPIFSPDGRYVYFSRDSTSGAFFQYNKDPNGEIYTIERLDRETGEIETLIGGAGGAARPAPSPDGTQIAFVRRVRYETVLFVHDLATGENRPLFDGLDRDHQETWAVHGVYANFDWTPDGQSIVIWAQGGLHRVDVDSGAVTPIPFRVRQTHQLQEALRFEQDPAPDQFETKMLRWVRVAPDGERVVFQALGKLWVRDLPNGTPRRLTQQDDHSELYPAFSRDGRNIAYVTWNDAEFGSVRLVSATGGAGRVLTSEPGHYVEPAVSPDGRARHLPQDGGWFLDQGSLRSRHRSLPGRYRHRRGAAGTHS